MKRFLISALLILPVLFILSGCSVKESVDDSFEVKFYFTNDGAQTFEYREVSISKSNMLKDTIDKMKEINDIQIDSIWSEGNNHYVDLNENVREKLDAGSAMSSAITGSIVRTLASYPDVETLEILLGGNRRESGEHFSFESYYIIKEDGKIIEKCDGIESEFQSWVE